MNACLLTACSDSIAAYTQVRPMMGVALTLLSRTAFTMTTFVAVTSYAMRQGTKPAAAHQVALQFFWFLTCAALKTRITCYTPTVPAAVNAGTVASLLAVHAALVASKRIAVLS